MRKIVTQLNLQDSLGGGEIYTRILIQAFADLGWSTRLFVNSRAKFWQTLLAPETEVVKIESMQQLEAALGAKGDLLLTHSTLDSIWAPRMACRATLVGMLHMPLYERFPEGLRHYHRLFAVSRHVAQSARSRGLENVSPVELLGVADTRPRGPAAPLTRNSCYDWDRRKFRDRFLGWSAGLWSAGLWSQPNRATAYEKIPGTLALGIVSRLTPIKQFPLMFSFLAPVIARYPAVRLEIFGSGGFASVRDLRSALGPCASQVRFWGQQSDVGAVYGQLDYVLSGLPEKEALGLNLIEAQVMGTPVIAVAAPPFIETVVDGKTGFLYRDPREDGGAEFAALLGSLINGAERPVPGQAEAHLAQFSAVAFRDRLQAALEGL